jgi:hypothetical protein
VDIGTTLKPSAKTVEAVQPCIGALDDPAQFAKAATVRFAAAGNRCGDAGGVQGPAILLVVVGAVRRDSSRLAQSSTAHATNRLDGVDQWKPLRDVVAAGARQDTWKTPITR